MSTKPMVLIVDDDEELLKLVALLLRRINIESVSCKNGASAIDQITNGDPMDMVILDLMLPDMHGYDVLRHIRTLSQMDGVPVLVLSAKADPTTIRMCLDNGADGYVTKPYLANTLISRVQTLLEPAKPQ
ncbi:MAG: response regulator [Chloroflexota bacterium]